MTELAITPSIDQASVERFARDGFLLVEDLFGAAELERFGAAVDEAVRQRTRDDERDGAGKNLYEQTFIQCMGLWEDHEAVRPLTFHPALCRTAAALLGVDRIRLWHDQALYKEAGGRGTDAHLDYPFWPVDEPRLVSAWIPLDDVAPGGGMMGYVRGSHTSGVNRFIDIGALRGGELENLLDDPEVARLPLDWVPVRRGSVIFHHANTIHTADANDTNRTRRVFTTVYIAEGCHRSRDDEYFFLDRDRIAVGDEIAGSGFPVAWPRDSGVLPEPPAERGPKTGFGMR